MVEEGDLNTFIGRMKKFSVEESEESKERENDEKNTRRSIMKIQNDGTILTFKPPHNTTVPTL